MAGTVTARDDRAAVDKAVSLLVALGEHRPQGLGVSELARRTGLSKSTAFRVLGMLERNEVVERVGTGYRLGSRMLQLGRAGHAAEHDRLRDLLLPFLADLYEITHQTVHLGVLHGTDVVYLAKLYGHRSAPAPSRIGGRLPAHVTAVGKALLGYDPVAARAVAVTRLHAVTRHSITDPEELTAQLTHIRRTGLAFDRQESRLGLTCVASPILNRAGTAVAALSISAPYGGNDPASLGADLRRVCAAASRAVQRSGAVRHRPATEAEPLRTALSRSARSVPATVAP